MEVLHSFANLINSHWWIWPLICALVGYYYRNPKFGMYAFVTMLALMGFGIMMKFQGYLKIHWVLVLLGPFYCMAAYPLTSVWYTLRSKLRKRR